MWQINTFKNIISHKVISLDVAKIIPLHIFKMSSTTYSIISEETLKITVNILKIRTPEKIAVITLKFEQDGFMTD